MAMRMSSLFLRTLRENPADAEVPSHQLLVRAGYIRRVSPGIYTWLPLGLKVLRRVETIVREEMDAIGAQELLFPALLPREPYEASGRWDEYGDNVFRLKDRKGADYLLGPTHEEMFTLAVKDLYSSYKDLPLSIYQIQIKYRDEARPRAGVLRGREFVMKDSYSFDIDEAGLDKSYQLHRDAYVRIFDRLGFHYVIVQAMAGAMGGSKSEEFLATAENGEDTYVRCTNCGYAANVEAVRVPVPDAVDASGRARRPRRGHPRHPDHRHPRRAPRVGVPALGRAGLGGRRTRSRTSSWCSCTPTAPASRWPSACPATARSTRSGSARRSSRPTVEAFDEKDFAANPTLAKGYIGPGVLGTEKASGIRYLLDPRVSEGTAWVTGADESGRHVIDLVAGPRLHRRRHHRGRRGARRRRLPVVRARAGVGARHRDGPHLPARHEVRRGARPEGARRERQAAHRDHGLLRRGCLARRRVRRRGQPRRPRPDLAPGAGPGRRARRRHRQGRGGRHVCRGAHPRARGPGRRRCCSTTAARPAPG